MKLTTVKGFIKKHTQSPEELVTELDLDEMNEWLATQYPHEVSALKASGIDIGFIRAVDVQKVEEDREQYSNDFWLVLLPDDGRFAIRQFAEGSPQAKNLVDAAFKIAPSFIEANARAKDAFREDAYMFNGTRSVCFNDWMVDTRVKTMSELGPWKTQSPIEMDSDFLPAINLLCAAQENAVLLQSKKFISSQIVHSDFNAQAIELHVNDDSYSDFRDRKIAGFSLGAGFAIAPLEYKDNAVRAMVALDFGNGFVPLMEDTSAQLAFGSESGPEIEISGGGCISSIIIGGESNDWYSASDILVLEFTDADLNLKVGTLEMLSLGKSPLEMLTFARGEKLEIQESYGFDISEVLDTDQEATSGLSL